jgi:hypothetical protein
MPPPRPRRWYAQLLFRDEPKEAISPVLPWKLLKTYLDGVLTQRPLLIEQIVIRPAGAEKVSPSGETFRAGPSPGSGAESE